MENNLTFEMMAAQPEMMAAQLYQIFQNHSIDIPQDKRKAYTIFAAIQHCNIVAHKNLSGDDLVYWAKVINKLTERII